MIDAGRHSVLGVLVDAVDYDRAVGRVIDAAKGQQPLAVSALAVHGVMTGVQDDEHRRRLNGLDLVVPDGQPVRWALKWLHGIALPDRVYGPELTLRVLAAAADEALPVYLYGSNDATLDALESQLHRRFPALRVAGREPSKFQAGDAEEMRALAARVSRSGARVLLVGLGCPRQEVFVSQMRDLVPVPMLAVGAAFDYHAGLLASPPSWMQERGLEWLWRLRQEPRRLWRRYVLLNPAYLGRLLAQRLRVWRPVADQQPAERLPAIPM